jgi:hypothetical protein
MSGKSRQASNLEETPIDNPQELFDFPGFEDIISLKEWEKLVRLTGGDKKTPYLRILTVPPSFTFIKKGEYDMHIFILLEGVVEAVIQDEKGLPKTAKKFMPGNCFGELGVIEQIARTADVRSSIFGCARLLKIDWTVTEKQEHAEVVIPLLKLVIKKTVDNTRSGHAAIGRVIVKATTILQEHENELSNLHLENSVLESEVAQKDAVIEQMQLLLKVNGINYEETAPVIYKTDQPLDNTRIDAAIELLEAALKQIKPD